MKETLVEMGYERLWADLLPRGECEKVKDVGMAIFQLARWN